MERHRDERQTRLRGERLALGRPSGQLAKSGVGARSPRALALIWHDLIGYEPADFGRRFAEVGGRLNPALAATPKALGLDDQDTWEAKIPMSGHFTTPTTSRYRFSRPLDAAGVVAMLNTYGVNKGLDPTTRHRLDKALTELVETEFDGTVIKIEEAVLHTARRT